MSMHIVFSVGINHNEIVLPPAYHLNLPVSEKIAFITITLAKTSHL